MKIFSAIDNEKWKCVRLIKGIDEEIIFNDDPIMAKNFEESN